MSSFHWQTAPHREARSSQFCDVPGLGRLLARREAKGSRKFRGFLNGASAIIECGSIEEAKQALEAVARRVLASGRP